MRFADIPGHEGVKRVVRSMADTGRMPHALLFQGPEGSGKLMMARALAQYIHCEHPAGGEPCGQCGPCRQHQGWNHIDTFYVFPVVKSEGSGPKEPVSDDYRQQFTEFAEREPLMDSEAWALTFAKKNAVPQIYVHESNAILERLSTTAHASRYKIVVIWLPERMNEGAANKLLKILEEPFSDTIFLLASDHPEGLLPTIYSRCRRIEMPRHSDAEVAAWLLATGQCDSPEAAAETAAIAGGSLLAARKLAADARNGAPPPPYLQLFIDLMRAAWQRRVADLKRWAEQVTELGRESELRFYAYCQRLIRDNFMLGLNLPQLTLLTPAEEQFSRNFARFITHNNAPGIIDVLDEAMTDIAGNANGKIVNFHLALQIIMLIQRA